MCPGTVLPEGVPTARLLVNHFALTDSDDIFDTVAPNGVGPQRSYTLADTGGCSCEQIIDVFKLGEGHKKHGCSIGVMDDAVDWAAAGGGPVSQTAPIVAAPAVPPAQSKTPAPEPVVEPKEAPRRWSFGCNQTGTPWTVAWLGLGLLVLTRRRHH